MTITIRPGERRNTYVVTAPTAGVVRDTGTVTWERESESTFFRRGQRVENWKGSGTFVGRRGRLRLRFDIDWLDAGRGYEAGDGIWGVIRSSGAYAGWNGGGKSAHVWLPSGPAAGRAEGIVSVP